MDYIKLYFLFYLFIFLHKKKEISEKIYILIKFKVDFIITRIHPGSIAGWINSILFGLVWIRY